MRVILSRKGVDSAAGECASPLIDGRPVSIPIPTNQPSPTTYEMLADHIRGPAGDLSRGLLSGPRSCHLDPDIDMAALPNRPDGWRGALGQAGAALTHLRNRGVSVGDLFLFWGLYRPAQQRWGQWVYVGPRQHAIFGWLKIGAILDAGTDGSQLLDDAPWLASHPHARAGWTPKNAIYVAADGLELAGRTFAGSGVFARAHTLTADDATRPTHWSVPAWLNPRLGGTGLSCHAPNRWGDNGKLQVASRGQEFVADISERLDALEWLADLLGRHA